MASVVYGLFLRQVRGREMGPAAQAVAQQRGGGRQARSFGAVCFGN